jgi:hypothetical protein
MAVYTLSGLGHISSGLRPPINYNGFNRCGIHIVDAHPAVCRPDCLRFMPAAPVRKLYLYE